MKQDRDDGSSTSTSKGRGTASVLLRRKETMYQPSIYRYNCIGAYNATSGLSGVNPALDAATSRYYKREGMCRGLKTQLELLEDLPISTRHGALKEFTYMTNYELDDGHGNGGSSPMDDHSALDPQTKTILVSPALIYKEDGKNNEASKKEAGKKRSSIKKPAIPEEEWIKNQGWSCYGYTEVEYLTLKNLKTGSQKIAAVAPHNSGISIRHIRTADDNKVTNITAGWLSLVIDSVENDPIEERKKRLESSQQETTQQPREGPVHPHMPHADAVPPKPPVGSLDAAKKSIQVAATFGGKVFEHCKMNLHWLYNTLQDDFIERTQIAGRKIIEQGPKTVERTTNYIGKQIMKAIGKHNDDRDDDN